MHKLLERQLRRHLGADATIPEPFLQAVDEAYFQADDDRSLLEHSMDVVSEEQEERSRLLQEALAESRQAVEERNHTLALLKSTLDSTADGILVVDTEGRTVLANLRFTEIWRLPDEVLNSAADDRLEYVREQLKDPDEFMRKVRELQAQPEAECSDILHFKDRRMFERYSVPHRLDGRPIGRLWIFRDVTARRQLEDQLRQAQKMDAVGKLAGGVAHDFNNLITVMKMHCEFLAEGMDKVDPRLEDVREIGDAANRAAALTRQLLAFSRKQVLKPEVVKVNEVVAGLQGMLSRLIGEDITVATELAGDDPSVLADRGQLEQVVVNLAVNARDAMAGGGRLTLRTATVRMDGAYGRAHGAVVPEGLYTMISVTDTGCGIPKEIQDRIFEPFFTTKELGRGTGLGLSTVYGIVKQSNGFVWLYSEAGLGTTFKIHLPAAGAEVPAESGEALLEHRRGTETILLAEDEEPVRNGVRRVLERHGYRVLVARNGQDALRRAAAHDGEIALLVTDVVMPEMGGAPLVERLRSLRPGIRVVFMSGYTDDDIVRRGIQTGAAGFIEKPFTASALTGAVRAALDRPKETAAA